MWWVILMAGVAALAVGGVNLSRYFREGPEPERGFGGSGPAHRLVSAAMFTAGGLFLAFFSLANLIAGYAGHR
jgi:hypothetical protein